MLLRIFRFKLNKWSASSFSEWTFLWKSEMSILLFSTPRPVIVEPLEQLDDEDGLPEKLAQKNPMYQK